MIHNILSDSKVAVVDFMLLSSLNVADVSAL